MLTVSDRLGMGVGSVKNKQIGPFDKFNIGIFFSVGRTGVLGIGLIYERLISLIHPVSV